MTYAGIGGITKTFARIFSFTATSTATHIILGGIRQDIEFLSYSIKHLKSPASRLFGIL